MAQLKDITTSDIVDGIESLESEPDLIDVEVTMLRRMRALRDALDAAGYDGWTDGTPIYESHDELRDHIVETTLDYIVTGVPLFGNADVCEYINWNNYIRDIIVDQCIETDGVFVEKKHVRSDENA